jgi:hypothetical protein
MAWDDRFQRWAERNIPNPREDSRAAYYAKSWRIVKYVMLPIVGGVVAIQIVGWLLSQ